MQGVEVGMKTEKIAGKDFKRTYRPVSTCPPTIFPTSTCIATTPSNFRSSYGLASLALV